MAIRVLLLWLGAWFAFGCTPTAPAAPPAGTPPSPNAPLQTLKWGYQGKQIIQLPLVVAERTGLLAQEGLTVEGIQMNSPTLTTTALVAGEIDYADGFSSAIRDAMHGLPIKAIVAGERYSSYQVLARPEIKTVADLKGGKGGVSRSNSGDYYILVDWLRRQGLDADNDVTMINIGGTDARFNSLVSGAIDVALLAAPASLLAIKGGARVLGNPDSLISYPLGGLATTEKKLSEQRADVRKTLRAYLQALQLMQRDEDTTVAAIRAYLDVDEEVARGSYRFVRDTMSPDGTTPEAGIRLIIDIERAAIGTTEEFPLSTGVDFSVLQEVQRELSGAAPGNRTP